MPTNPITQPKSVSRRNAALRGWRRPSAIQFEDQRACSDCDDYTPLGDMITKADGRVICSDCETKLNRQQVERAQGDLFVEQRGLFQ